MDSWSHLCRSLPRAWERLLIITDSRSHPVAPSGIRRYWENRGSSIANARALLANVATGSRLWTTLGVYNCLALRNPCGLPSPYGMECSCDLEAVENGTLAVRMRRGVFGCIKSADCLSAVSWSKARRWNRAYRFEVLSVGFVNACGELLLAATAVFIWTQATTKKKNVLVAYASRLLLIVPQIMWSQMHLWGTATDLRPRAVQESTKLCYLLAMTLPSWIVRTKRELTNQGVSRQTQAHEQNFDSSQ